MSDQYARARNLYATGLPPFLGASTRESSSFPEGVFPAAICFQLLIPK